MLTPGEYTPVFENIGVFPYKSDESQSQGHPHINKQGFINPGSTLTFSFSRVWFIPRQQKVKLLAAIATMPWIRGEEV